MDAGKMAEHAVFACKVQIEKMYFALLEEQKKNYQLMQQIEELKKELASVTIVSTG